MSLPLAPIRIPIFGWTLTRTDPAYPLVPRPWSEFFGALVSAITTLQAIVAPVWAGSASVSGRTSSITTTAVASSLAAGRYRLSSYLRVSTPASVSSSLQITLGWTNGVAQTKVGASLTGNLATTYESLTAIMHVDAGSSLTYTVAWGSVGTNMAYTVEIYAERLP